MFGRVQQGVAMQNLKWKMLLILAVLGFSVYSFVPPQKKISLGLDLRGGIHMVLQVVTDDALNQELDQTAETRFRKGQALPYQGNEGLCGVYSSGQVVGLGRSEAGRLHPVRLTSTQDAE